MTIWGLPDYQASIDISALPASLSRKLSGNTFSVEIYRKEYRTPVTAVMLWNQILTSSRLPQHDYVWLILDSKRAIISENQGVTIRLIEECDPALYMTEENQALSAYLPLDLQGIIITSKRIDNRPPYFKDKNSDGERDK